MLRFDPPPDHGSSGAISSAQPRLLRQVEEEGAAEAETYKKLACFCEENQVIGFLSLFPQLACSSRISKVQF